MTDDMAAERPPMDGAEYWHRLAVEHERRNRELQDENDRLTGSNLKLATEATNAHDKVERLTALAEKHLERKQQADLMLKQAREDLAEMRRMRDSAGETVLALNERIAAFGRLADMYDTGDGRSKAVARVIRSVITTGEEPPTLIVGLGEAVEHPDTPTPLPKRESLAVMELMRRVGALQARVEGIEAQVTDANTRMMPAPAISAEQADAINQVLQRADDWTPVAGKPEFEPSELDIEALREAVQAWREAGGRPEARRP